MLTCGIDEAGRGPVIGPLVIAGVMVDEAGLEKLKALGVKDSKMLSPHHREKLFHQIEDVATQSVILSVEPWQIDKVLESADMNLNWLEAKKTVEILAALNAKRAYVDCPSNNIQAYTAYLKNLLQKDMELVVEHKADQTYPEASAASILAKVTRDRAVATLREHVGIDFGSGYPSDPLTKAFIRDYHAKHPELFRHSWQTYKDALARASQTTLDL